jgi:hypothetical protein
MACSSCGNSTSQYGVEPINAQWKVVRGDTATLIIDFLENDESTAFLTTGWTYKATAYDPQGNVLDNIDIVDAINGSVTLLADSCLTEKWGTGYKSIVAELPFDLQITIPGESSDTVWTPIIGTICVYGNVTPGGSL